MTAPETDEVADSLAYLSESVADGEHWYIAVLKTMAGWSLPEETIDGRTYHYLIGGEAFDWLLLIERLVDELGDVVGKKDRKALLFHGHPPLEIDEDEFQALIGTPKHQAYLNFLYGIVVEEALQLAVEQEVEKERHGQVLSNVESAGDAAFQRLYGNSEAELLGEFRKEKKLPESDRIELSDLREFTYWLFKFRVRRHEGARVASDTRKGLVALSRVEVAFRRRLEIEKPLDLEKPGLTERSATGLRSSP